MNQLKTKGFIRNRFNLEREKFNHYIIELFDITPLFLKNKELLIKETQKLIKSLNLKIVGMTNYEYKPHGLTIAFILSSSHLIVHTWPEYSYLHIDLFSCSYVKSKEKILPVVKKIFNHKGVSIRKIRYG